MVLLPVLALILVSCQLCLANDWVKHYVTCDEYRSADRDYCAGMPLPNNATIPHDKDPGLYLIQSESAQTEGIVCYCFKSVTVASQDECSYSDECEINSRCVIANTKSNSNRAMKPTCRFPKKDCGNFWSDKREKGTNIGYCEPNYFRCDDSYVHYARAVRNSIETQFINPCVLHMANYELYQINPHRLDSDYWANIYGEE